MIDRVSTIFLSSKLYSTLIKAHLGGTPTFFPYMLPEYTWSHQFSIFVMVHSFMELGPEFGYEIASKMQ